MTDRQRLGRCGHGRYRSPERRTRCQHANVVVPVGVHIHSTQAVSLQALREDPREKLRALRAEFAKKAEDSAAAQAQTRRT